MWYGTASHTIGRSRTRDCRGGTRGRLIPSLYPCNPANTNKSQINETTRDLRSDMGLTAVYPTMRAELIGHLKVCMTEIYLHIDARMADYIRTHPYVSQDF